MKYGKQHEVTVVQIANYLINQGKDLNDEVEIMNNIKSKTIGVVGDDATLQVLAKEALKDNPHLVEVYKKGKTTVIMALIGTVMKKTAGKADAQKVRQILESLLKKP